MKIQEIVSDVRTRVESAGKQYQDAFKAYVDAQKKAFGIVSKNGQTLANTEIGAAKNVFAAAKASFDKARTDGVRKVANNPQAYVPNGRDQIISAYKDTIDLLVKTGNELTEVVNSGYQSVRAKLSGTSKRAKASTAKRSTGAKSTRSSTARKTSSAKSGAAKSSASKSTATKRKTASTRSASGTKSAAKSTTTRKRSASKSSTSTASKSTGSTGSNGSAS